MAKKINYNQALSSSFRLVIPGLEEVNYFVQNTELPSINFSGIRTDYKNFAGNLPNNKIEYDPLNATFLVDEDYANHQALHLWMHQIRHGDKPLIQEMKDITLHLTTSTKNTGRAAIFRGAHPIMLTAIPLESSTTDAMPAVCTVGFQYQYYEIVELNDVN